MTFVRLGMGVGRSVDGRGYLSSSPDSLERLAQEDTVANSMPGDEEAAISPPAE
jgi:hypothetical protein